MRYTSKYGVVYDLRADGDAGNYLLSKVHFESKMVGRGHTRREEISERFQTYLVSSREDCLKYLKSTDAFDEGVLNENKR